MNDKINISHLPVGNAVHYCDFRRWNPNQGLDKLTRRALRAAQVHSKSHLKMGLVTPPTGGMR
jgi:hypothetical protein